MRGNSLGHLGIAGFGRSTVCAASRGVLDDLFGVAALARPGAAQNQGDAPKRRSIHGRTWHRFLLYPRNHPGSRDAEGSGLAVCPRGPPSRFALARGSCRELDAYSYGAAPVLAPDCRISKITLAQVNRLRHAARRGHSLHRKLGGINENRGWLSLWQGTLFGRRRAGFRRR